MADSIFLKIINRELPAEIVYEDEHCVAIKDIAPKAPVHLLIIPRKVIPRLCEAQPEDLELLGHMMLTAGEVARRVGVEDAFRLIVNNGSEAGQTVFHLHLHLLAGKNFSESQLGF
jgi:histidine triad (HIT) family protein